MAVSAWNQKAGSRAGTAGGSAPNVRSDAGSRPQKAGIADLGDTVDFINNFECVVLSDNTIAEDSLQDTIKTLSVINTRDYRNLKNYYNMAKTNTDIYTKISYVNKIIYDKPLTLIRSNSQEQKQFVKKKDEFEYKQTA